MTCRSWVRGPLLALTLPLVQPAPAAPQPGSPDAVRLTLAQAIDEALAHAPAIAAADAQALAAHLKAASVGRSRAGSIDAIASLTRFQDDVILRTISRELIGTQGFAGLPFDRDQAHYGLTFEFPLYLGGRLSAAIDIARLQADALALAAQGTRWDIRANATTLYTSVQALDAVGRALDRNLEALDATRGSVVLMVQQGRRPDLDRLKLDEEIEATRADRSRVQADAARARAFLLALVGRDPAATLDVDLLPSAALPELPAPDELQGLALAASPVQRATLAQLQAERAIDEAQAASHPKLVARGSWMGHAAPSTDAMSTWDVSVGLAVPIFDGGARRAGVASARENARAAASALSTVRLQRVAEAVSARATLEAARNQVQAAGARVDAAAEAARIEQLRYDTGAGTIEDLLRARAREVGARAALARVRGEVITAAAHLNAVVEREIVQ